MKKIIILAVLSLISLSTLRGQSKAEPSPAVAAGFNKQFKGAANVDWEKIGNVLSAQFQFQQHFTVAYFDAEGKLIATGRKINEDQLPMRLHADLLAVKSEREKKSGILSIGNIFEYIGDSDYTQYVTSLENDRESLVVGTVDGKMTIRSKTKREPRSTGTPKELIAGLPK